MAVGAENEWHPNHDTRNTVRYYGKNKVWYQTTLPPSILKCSLLLPTQRKKMKKKKETKNLSLSIFVYSSILSLSIFMFGKSPSPIQTEGKKN